MLKLGKRSKDSFQNHLRFSILTLDNPEITQPTSVPFPAYLQIKVPLWEVPVSFCLFVWFLFLHTLISLCPGTRTSLLSLRCVPGALSFLLTSPPRPGTPCPRTVLLAWHLSPPCTPRHRPCFICLRPGNPGFSHFPVLGHPRSFHLPAPGNPALPTFLSPELFACGSEPGPHPPRPALPSEDRGRGVGGTPERRAQDPAAPSLQQNCLYRRARPVRKYRSGRGRTATAGGVAREGRSWGVMALLHALSSLRLENFVHPGMGSGPASPSSVKRIGRVNPYSLHTHPKIK